MSIIYNLPVRNARLAVVLAAIDAGPGVGKLVIGTSGLLGGSGVLASIPLLKPSCSISGAVLTILGVPLSVYAIASGQAAKAELQDSNGLTVASGLTVGVSGADLIVANTTINTGEYVTLLSGAIQHP